MYFACKENDAGRINKMLIINMKRYRNVWTI